ncbi:MAG: nucleoside deaminase [Balneolaceae bacterium]
MVKPNLQIMRAAIEVAEANQTPFGAALAMGDEIFVTAANQTQELNDPTAHAEVMAIRNLGKMIGKTDLSGFTLYTTCEPCPMCMSAAIWAKIDTLFFGCDVPTVATYMDQIHIQTETINQHSFHSINIKGMILSSECKALLDAFG